MFRSIRKFASSPMGRRAIMWLAPVIVGWVMNKFSKDGKNSSGKKSGRRR